MKSLRSSSYVSLEQAFRSGASSPLVLAEHALERIEQEEAQLRAFVHIDAERALAQAHAATKRWGKGQPLSRLDGVLLAVKDIIETADMPTGQGSVLWTGFESKRDAATVMALRQAGAVVLGKTATTEYALTELLASTTNPHDAARTPGGSSSGSAAIVGAGIVPLALGSQVVGSTIRPSSYCGCYGFKPTVGALNRGGSYDYFSQSCVGLMAGALEDAWEAACEVARRVGGDPGFPGMAYTEGMPEAAAPRRLAMLQTDGWRKTSPGARHAFEAKMAELRQAGVEVLGREDDPELESFETQIEDVMSLTWRIMAWELRWPQGADAVRNGWGISRAVLGRLQEGLAMTRDDYARALAEREQIRGRAAALLRRYDGFALLSATGAAPLGFASTGHGGMNVPVSLLGLPALSLPLLCDDGLPLGLQLVGTFDQEIRLAAMARWIVALP